MNPQDVVTAPRNIGSKAWATRRMPPWVIVAIAVIIAATVVLSLVHKPSQAERASDFRGYLGDVNAGIISCAGGLRDAITALDTVEAGDTAQYSAAQGILAYNAQNCSPANNESLQNFTNYQVAESLASFNLDTADNDVITWAFDAQAAMNDMIPVLEAKTPAAKAQANATLKTEMDKVNAVHATILSFWDKAQKSTDNGSPFPNLSS
ncbi:MAG TPA: hypothetical protein VG142_17715 [Trebonia sp.]|jgi:hypothetical protein|nr:hypothetical protein [Trebonia sp.]